MLFTGSRGLNVTSVTKVGMLIVAAFLGGAITAGVIAYVASRPDGVDPTIRDGYAYADSDASAIGFFPKRDSSEGAQGFDLTGADWLDAAGSWHDWETPNCLEPERDNQPIRIATVMVNPTEHAFGREVVVWFNCLAD